MISLISFVLYFYFLLRKSISRQADKKSGSPRGERVLKEEIGVWNSQGGGKDRRSLFLFLYFISLFFFSLSTFLSLSHIKWFLL